MTLRFVFVTDVGLAVWIRLWGESAHVRAVNLPHNSDGARWLIGDVNTSARLSVRRSRLSCDCVSVVVALASAAAVSHDLQVHCDV